MVAREIDSFNPVKRRSTCEQQCFAAEISTEIFIQRAENGRAEINDGTAAHPTRLSK